MSHKSRNTMTYKTNSVHSIKTKKQNGLSGELYGFNTVQQFSSLNQVSAPELNDQQIRYNKMSKNS